VGSDQTAGGTTRGATKAWLHGIAELLLAGPQYRRSGTIRLRVTEDGFATVTQPETSYSDGTVTSGDTRIPLGALTYAEIGERLGCEAGAPEGLYQDGSGAKPNDVPAPNEAAALELVTALSRGDQALRLLAPNTTPVLWPEHFDVSVTLDEVNYGVSPGDGYLDEPYMYVGPRTPPAGAFWNAPFGAARPLAATVEEAAEFFAEGRRLIARG